MPDCGGVSDREDLYVVLLAVRVSGDEGEVFAAGLCHEHPVDRVAVDHGQPPCGHGVGEADGQFPEAAVADALGQVRRRGYLAERLLDGDLPDGSGADTDIWLVIEAVLDLVGQLRVVGEPPEHDVSVQQQAHYVAPKSAAMDSLTASESQSGVRTSWPRSDPRPARWILPASGITLATGSAGPADDDLLAVLHPLDDLRQVGLGVMDVELLGSVS